MRPGQRLSRVVTVRNTGKAAGRFGLTATTTGSAELIRRLRVRVAVADREVAAFTGGLESLREVHLATLGPGKSVRVALAVRFASTSEDDRLQGHAAEATFNWSAKSVIEGDARPRRVRLPAEAAPRSRLPDRE
jgi:hypothetical protein